MIEERRHDRRVGRVALFEFADLLITVAFMEKLEQLECVDEVAVVGKGDRAIGARAKRWLGVHPVARAGRRVARVAHGHVTLEGFEVAFVEHLGDKPHVLVHEDLLAVRGRDARGFLPAVLERVQPEIGQGGNVFPWREYAKNAAFILRAAIVGKEVVVESSVCG